MTVATLTVVVGIPSVMLLWIAGVVLFVHDGRGTRPGDVLAWLVAALVGGALWPTLRWRLDGDARAATASASQTPRGENALRAFVVGAGAVALVAMCGAPSALNALLAPGGVFAPGPRSATALLQFAGVLAVFALLLPVLAVTERAVRRAVTDDERAAARRRRDWYAAAAIAWPLSLLAGLVLTSAARALG